MIETLKNRFEKNILRHKDIKWADVEARLLNNTDKLLILNEMENTGGEPDVIDYDQKADKFIFCDCSTESPKGRRSLCYDREALNARKHAKPKDSAIDMASNMKIELLDEAQYRKLQMLGKFDTKTSSWIATPPEIRKLGGALFADRRYNTVFVYHNGADSYYAARGFRGICLI